MFSLVVDDEFVALNKMVAMLWPFGQCDAATNGQQALDLFRQALDKRCPYHLVTIDINMPDPNGITLLGMLQHEERSRGAARSKKIIVTADGTSANVLAALTGQCDGFIVKPVRQAVLMEKLASLGFALAEVAEPRKH